MPKIITSISPNNIKNQRVAINTWQRLGFDVYSMNTPKEMPNLKRCFRDVTFIQAKETAADLYFYDIPYPTISEMIEFAFNQDEPTWIINSDIHLRAVDAQIESIQNKAKESMVFGRRTDIVDIADAGNVYNDGFDWFVLYKDFDHLFTSTYKFCIGQPFWDYWLPITFIRKGIPPFLCINEIAYHIKHEANWNSDQLKFFGSMLASETNIKIRSHQINLLTYICNTTIYEGVKQWET